MNLLLSLRRLTGALFLLLPWAGHAQAPAVQEPVFAGVPQENIDLSAPDFKLFDRKFYDNQLFLLGESHGVQRPQEVDFALLKHLNERTGLRTYVAEVDCSKAYYLNEYLRTGQDSTLRLVFRSWVGPSQWGNQDFFQKIQRIRALNQTLAVARRIRFVGLDELQDLPLTADYVADMLRNKPLSPDLRGQIDSVAALLRQSDTQVLAGVAGRAVLKMTNQEAVYRKKLGSAYDDLRHVLLNMTDARGNAGQREQNIFANFQRLYRTKQWAHEKLYGMWGLAHVLQAPVQGGYPSVAARIRQSQLPVCNKIVSVLCVFSGCQMLFPTAGLPAPWQTAGQVYSATDKFNHDGPLVVLEGLVELKQRTAPGSTTLFRLDAPEATTTRRPIRLRYAPGMPANQQMQFSAGLPAASYVQYLLLVRDSGPVRPLLPAPNRILGHR